MALHVKLFTRSGKQDLLYSITHDISFLVKKLSCLLGGFVRILSSCFRYLVDIVINLHFVSSCLLWVISAYILVYSRECSPICHLLKKIISITEVEIQYKLQRKTVETAFKLRYQVVQLSSFCVGRTSILYIDFLILWPLEYPFRAYLIL